MLAQLTFVREERLTDAPTKQPVRDGVIALKSSAHRTVPRPHAPARPDRPRSGTTEPIA